MLIVPDFSAEDIKTGLDIIDSEYKDLLRFSSRTRNLLETLGVNFELREDVMGEEDKSKTQVKRLNIEYFNIGNNDREASDTIKKEPIEDNKPELVVDQELSDTDSDELEIETPGDITEEGFNEHENLPVDNIDNGLLKMDQNYSYSEDDDDAGKKGSKRENKQELSSAERKEEIHVQKVQEVRDLVSRENELWKCKKCERSFQNKSIAHKHAELHVPGLSYPCENCHQTFTSRSRLGKHRFKIHRSEIRNKKSKRSRSVKCRECATEFTRRANFLVHYRSLHEGVRYPCDQCDYQATTQGNLQTHIQSKHEDVKYPCDQCDYQAKQQSHLQTHIHSLHEGIKYPCNQCEYRATRQDHLKNHIQSQHEGVRYPCDKCDYQAKLQGNLKKHIQSKHEDYTRTKTHNVSCN